MYVFIALEQYLSYCKFLDVYFRPWTCSDLVWTRKKIRLIQFHYIRKLVNLNHEHSDAKNMFMCKHDNRCTTCIYCTWELSTRLEFFFLLPISISDMNYVYGSVHFALVYCTIFLLVHGNNKQTKLPAEISHSMKIEVEKWCKIMPQLNNSNVISVIFQDQWLSHNRNK